MSLLIISEEKIKQVLSQIAPPSFEVEGLELASPPALNKQKGQFMMSGTVSIPPNNEAARTALLAAFSRIDCSGIAPRTEEELRAELDEIRRRNL